MVTRTYRSRPTPPIAALALVLLLTSVSPQAGDLDRLDEMIMQLGHDSFDMREEAEEKLAKLPPGYARVFLKLSQAMQDQEIKLRLVRVARKIFERTIVVTNDSWLKLHATLGLSYHVEYAGERDPWSQPRQLLGFLVDSMDGDSPCSEKLKRFDLIVAIDSNSVSGQDLSEYLKAGKDCELTVRRYKNTEAIAARGDVDPDDKNFEVLKIKVQTGFKLKREIDADELCELTDGLWQKFLRDFYDSDNQTLNAAK